MLFSQAVTYNQSHESNDLKSLIFFDDVDLADRHPGIVEKMDRIMHEAQVPSQLFPLFDAD